MGLMDGAVNGMVSRLLRVAFSPSEAFCLAQAAYIKEHKRAQGVPHPVLERQQATWEINQALKLLGDFPMGPEAHRQRIILWEKVFGRGSWHEPIDPEWIYGTSVPRQSESAPAGDERSGAIDEWSGVSAEPKPAVQIPESDELISLPEFDAAVEAMIARFADNGNDSHMLWPLMDQYLQPFVFRYPLRAYMTDKDVSGEWLVQKYVDYMGQSMTLAKISAYCLANDQVGASENEALKEFVYKSTGDFYSLIMCAVERADRERLVWPDGSPCQLDPGDFLQYSAMLDEIVTAQDANDPVRLMQQFLERQQEA